jgi:hypothetical protein
MVLHYYNMWFTELMPGVHYFVLLHMCVQVCQKVSNDGWSHTKPFQGQFFTKRFSIHKEKETFVPWLNSMPRHLVLLLELSFYNNSELERPIATQMKLGRIMNTRNDLA